ncbi:MAG: exopolyphosphatase [Liquorilactobacillus hordei]|uniref:exopolyphosphatase n=1 Tax=Liquorilactobacillus hordei TaxID=468911 RepID=UPI0039E7D264
MAKKLYGIIYMTPRQTKLSIVDLNDFSVIEEVTSNFYSNHTYEYQHNIQAITKSLNGFLLILKEYGVKNYRFWGNQQPLDEISARYLGEQIYVRTTLRVHWLNTSQLTYYKAVAIVTHLDNFKKISSSLTFLLSLGSERVSLSQFNNQKFASTWNVDLGSAQLYDVNRTLKPTTNSSMTVLDDYIDSKLEHLKHVFANQKISSNLILQDSLIINKKFIPVDQTSYAMSLEEFKKLYQKVTNASDQFLMDFFKVDENEITSITSYFLLLNKIIRLIKAQNIILTDITVSDGLAIDRAQRTGLKKQNFDELILTTAENMATRYLTSKSHRENVTMIALHLFDQLKKLHHLGKRERLLLQVSCILADIGNYINQQGHYNHSAYILQSTKVLGLSNTENLIIAEIARYHSSESPSSSATHFKQLDPEVQMKVAKLSSFLRIADSLDDSREEKIQKISISLRETELIIFAYSNQNIALEQWSFTNKAELFEKVFGLKAILKQRRQLQ